MTGRHRLPKFLRRRRAHTPSPTPPPRTDTTYTQLDADTLRARLGAGLPHSIGFDEWEWFTRATSPGAP